MTSPFDILGIQPGAEPEVIDAAYRALMKKYHPDRSGPDGLEKAKEITLAYAALKERAPDLTTHVTEPKADPAPYDPPLDFMPTPPLQHSRMAAVTLLVSIGILALCIAIYRVTGP